MEVVHMYFHHESRENVVMDLNSDAIRGLLPEQVEQNLSRYGENKLREKKKKTNFERFRDQFKDVMILILLVAAAISFVIACVEGNPKEFLNPS